MRLVGFLIRFNYSTCEVLQTCADWLWVKVIFDKLCIPAERFSFDDTVWLWPCWSATYITQSAWGLFGYDLINDLPLTLGIWWPFHRCSWFSWVRQAWMHLLIILGSQDLHFEFIQHIISELLILRPIGKQPLKLRAIQIHNRIYNLIYLLVYYRHLILVCWE